MAPPPQIAFTGSLLAGSEHDQQKVDARFCEKIMLKQRAGAAF
jgi:hypothetical protein